MYKKDLTKDLRLRLSEDDMNFLTSVADDRGVTVSACIRMIIGEYRRSLEAMKVLSATLELAKAKEMSNGDTETDFNDKL